MTNFVSLAYFPTVSNALKEESARAQGGGGGGEREKFIDNQ
jgi:hypothetical protein